VAWVFTALAVAAVVGCVVTLPPQSGNARPVEQWRPPEPRPPVLEALARLEGWIPYWTDEARHAREAAAAGFTDLLFFHGTVDEDGTVKLEKPDGLRAGRDEAVRAGVQPWLTVTNHGKPMDRALGTGRIQAHAESLLKAFADSRCRHLDLDYESLSLANARALNDLAEIIGPRLPVGSRLSFTLQPVDEALRPDHRAAYQALLDNPRVYTLRLMAYDYHWRQSLPGGLYPLPMFERLLNAWRGSESRLTLCLPLYGYDWPRPEDVSLPRADVVTLNDLARGPSFSTVWMEREAELATRYSNAGPRMAALPSYRAIRARVEACLARGIPAVSFWQLSCAPARQVAQASDPRQPTPREPVSPADYLAGWDAWLTPFRERVCRVVTAAPGDSLETIGGAHGVTRAMMLRFNAELASARDISGRRVFVPGAN
jgi:hypothetical protein